MDDNNRKYDNERIDDNNRNKVSEEKKTDPDKKKKASAAHMKATAKWEKDNYDKVLVRLPKGMKELIQATGSSTNGFIVEAVKEKLNQTEMK